MNQKQNLLPDDEVERVGRALRPYLDASADNIPPGIAYRLAEARRAALGQLQPAATIASVGGDGSVSLAGGWRTRLHDWRFWATGLVVTAVFATWGYRQWNEYVNARDTADVDVMLLADDVPVDALLDKGFSHFLRDEP